MRVRWREQAVTDRDDVEAYYGQYNLRAAVAAGDRIQEVVDLLETFPHMGHQELFLERERSPLRAAKAWLFIKLKAIR